MSNVFGAKIIYWLLYWPIFAVYLFFEVTKFVLTQLHRFTIPVFTILFVLENWILHKFGADNILVLRKIIYKDQWVFWLNNNFIKVGTNGIEIFLGKTVVITADIANIRSGPGKDKEVIITANQKATFVATGKQETLSDGEIWYELYIDADLNETGWASQKVIDFQ